MSEKKYYTSPVSGYTFTSKMETLHYLFSGMEERMLETHTNARDNELHVSYAWLPCGWLIEIRAGGKKMDKMYKRISMPAAAAKGAELRLGGPRYPKLSFPRYDGESDPLPWLNTCDNFFRGHHTMEEEKVWLASLHLDGVVASWYYQMERVFDIVSWPRFVEFTNMRFVEEYQRQFLAMLCRCDNLTPHHQVDLFTA
ncbi:hypothetical protein U9M48_031611 [Paspalum notatum var. saurae]|uniref:Retrotransposon gag domain-containing protein n=1 Tax=Paspalum notatum var. saurae TaxID=547442 RepID=A0AAQ3U3C1_PASNO